jgi:hypothetical protein
MVTIWLVSWLVKTAVPCPPLPPDPYGRNYGNVVYCFEDISHSKFFSSKKMAEAFAKAGENYSDLSDFKISKESAAEEFSK